MRSEGLCQCKIPMTPSGIEPATVRFVAQHLNHCNYIRACILSDTTTGGREYVYYIGLLLHVSAFFFGHLQVGIE